MYTYISFACLAISFWLWLNWPRFREGISLQIFASGVPIAMVSFVAAVITSFVIFANAPMKEVKVWHSDVHGVRQVQEVTPSSSVEGVMGVKHETSILFSSVNISGDTVYVRVADDSRLRVIVDEELACGEAVWKVYESIVDESWFFAGWAAPGVKGALVSVLRVGPGTLDR